MDYINPKYTLKYLKKEPNLTPYELVKQIRREIFESTQLTASAGKAAFVLVKIGQK